MRWFSFTVICLPVGLLFHECMDYWARNFDAIPTTSGLKQDHHQAKGTATFGDIMKVLQKYCSSFHKLTVKYCCKYFAGDPLDFGKVNWQVPPHTSLPLLTNQLALQNQKHNTQTTRESYISTNLCLCFGSNENGDDGYLTIPNHKLNAPQVRVGLQMIGNRFNGG